LSFFFFFFFLFSNFFFFFFFCTTFFFLKKNNLFSLHLPMRTVHFTAAALLLCAARAAGDVIAGLDNSMATALPVSVVALAPGAPFFAPAVRNVTAWRTGPAVQLVPCGGDGAAMLFQRLNLTHSELRAVSVPGASLGTPVQPAAVVQGVVCVPASLAAVDEHHSIDKNHDNNNNNINNNNNKFLDDTRRQPKQAVPPTVFGFHSKRVGDTGSLVRIDLATGLAEGVEGARFRSGSAMCSAALPQSAMGIFDLSTAGDALISVSLVPGNPWHGTVTTTPISPAGRWQPLSLACVAGSAGTGPNPALFLLAADATDGQAPIQIVSLDPVTGETAALNATVGVPAGTVYFDGILSLDAAGTTAAIALYSATQPSATLLHLVSLETGKPLREPVPLSHNDGAWIDSVRLM
jgi:hypothetical protein